MFLVKEKTEWFANGEVGIRGVSLSNCRGGIEAERNWDRKERSRIFCFAMCLPGARESWLFASRKGGRKQMFEHGRNALMKGRKASKVEAERSVGGI